MNLRRATLGSIVWVGALALSAQQYPIGRPTGDTVPPLGAGHGQEDDGPFNGTRVLQAHQAKLLREQHLKEVAADSARILALAKDLKAQTDQGKTATPAELKDVDEIARLAKRLTDHIKNE